MQRIVLALSLAGAAGLLAPKCTVRAPRAGLLRAEAAEAPAEATPVLRPICETTIGGIIPL